MEGEGGSAAGWMIRQLGYPGGMGGLGIAVKWSHPAHHNTQNLGSPGKFFLGVST
jgi:hypothetical protein